MEVAKPTKPLVSKKLMVRQQPVETWNRIENLVVRYLFKQFGLDLENLVGNIWLEMYEKDQYVSKRFVDNRCKDELGRLKTRKEMPLELLSVKLDLVSSPDLDSSNQAEVKDQLDKVLKCPLVDSRERSILRLRYYEDKTLSQIGLELGVSRQRVCQLINHTLYKLKWFDSLTV